MGERVEAYTPREIELKWQQKWEQDGLYRAKIDPDRPKHYALTMLPYPSGDLHIGHWYAMAPSDARARYMRMRGYNVLFPMGFDAFGLPAENAAIQRGIHPHTWTMNNIKRMRQQLKSMGAMFDWEREAITCLPGYYRWTQWFFLKLYDMGLAYRKKAPVDFCPKCNTTLAREQVWGEDRHCERCGTPVIKKELEQWFFKITDYAEELLDFSQIDWPERVVTMQKNWIGRSEGAEVTFRSEEGDPIVVFTTRPDTLWGATFMVLAPEHPLVEKLTTPEYREAMEVYRYQATRQSEVERLSTEKEKTGVFIGAYAINPVNGERIPIWIADYVMMTYGTGAIMAVPAHDERDFEFALKFGLPIIPVIDRPDGQAKSLVTPGSMRTGFAEALRQAGISFEEKDHTLYVTLTRDQIDTYIELAQAHIQPGHWNEVVGTRWAFIFADGIRELNSIASDREILARCKEIDPNLHEMRTVMELLWSRLFYRDVLFHAEYGTMINSAEFTGTPGDEAKQRVIAWLEEQGIGKFAINYRLRDWLISRQRYWGAPIPMIYCDHCGIVPVPYEDLPVLLPEDAEFLPTGESPLKYHEGFLHTTCPKCGRPATRETDTMDTFMCSSWYQYAYLSPYYKEGEPAHADSMPFAPEEGKYWLPVDVYTGGVEHATMHLIYTRFFTKAMRDMGLVDFDEPMIVLRNQGTILGEPQDGDFVEAEGRWEGDAFHADVVRVRRFASRDEYPAPGTDEHRVWGEVYWRDDAGLKVQTGEGEVFTVVQIDEHTRLEIPDVEKPTVYNIRMHLDVEKMSKSKGNVVAPDALVEQYGADTVRAYLMFGWRWELGGPWDSKGIEGVHRFLHRVWDCVLSPGYTGDEKADEKAIRALRRKVHQAIRRATEDMEAFSFNTYIANLMELNNTMLKAKETPVYGTDAWNEAVDTLILLLAPPCPHIAEELWARTGHPYSVHTQPWPTWDEEVAAEEMLVLPVQVNGKVRDRIEVPVGTDAETIKQMALASDGAKRHTEGKTIRKVIYVPDRLVNIVVS